MTPETIVRLVADAISDKPRIRACYVCQHSTIADTADLPLICENPRVTTGERALVECVQARANNGACGPQALHLRVKGE